MKITLPDGRELTPPNLKVAVAGHPGSGKSAFFATFPKPMVVLATDPVEKMLPYIDTGELDTAEYRGAQGQPVRLVKSRKSGAAIVQIEMFYDTNPKVAGAMDAFMTRMEALQQEVNNGQWATVVVDSWSGLEDIAIQRRKVGKFAINNNDGRAAYNWAKEDVKQELVNRLVHFNCNMGLTLHITEKVLDEGGAILYNFKTIGTLHSTIGQNVAERYRAEATADGVTRRLFTRPDGRFNLCTMIDAPSPCANNYSAILSNWVAKQAAMGAAAPAPQSVTEEIRPAQKGA